MATAAAGADAATGAGAARHPQPRPNPVAVGSGTPLRWLLLSAADDGRIRCLLWEVLRQGNRQLATAVTAADAVPALLQQWVKDYLSE